MVSAGDKIRASDIFDVDRVGCRLRRAAVQSVVSGTWTPLSWDTEDQDTDAFWSSGTTITIPSGFDGIYAITGYGSVAGTNQLDMEITLVSSITGMPTILRTDSNYTICSISATIPLAGADTVTIDVRQTDGVNKNVTGWVSFYYIRA